MIKYAVFNSNSELLFLNTTSRWKKEYLDELLETYNINSAILGASGFIPPALIRQIESKMHLIVLDTDTRIPMEVKYETPNTLGRDRIAAAVGGWKSLGSGPICVITLGTCITYNIVNKEGQFLGGNISPGLDMRLKAMNEFTANLPLVERGDVKNLVGKNTEEALQKGAGLGALFEIESFIQRIGEEYSGINTILTGGDAIFFAEKIKSKIFVNPDLVLIGLNEILKFNA